MSAIVPNNKAAIYEDGFEISHEFSYDLIARYDIDGTLTGFRGCHAVLVDFEILPPTINVSLASIFSNETGQLLSVCPRRVKNYLVFGGINYNSDLIIRLQLRHFEPKKIETDPEDMSLHDYMVMAHGSAYTDTLPLNEFLDKYSSPLPTIRNPKGIWSRPSEFAFKEVDIPEINNKRNVPAEEELEVFRTTSTVFVSGIRSGGGYAEARRPKPTPTPTNGRIVGRRPPK